MAPVAARCTDCAGRALAAVSARDTASTSRTSMVLLPRGAVEDDATLLPGGSAGHRGLRLGRRGSSLVLADGSEALDRTRAALAAVPWTDGWRVHSRTWSLSLPPGCVAETGPQDPAGSMALDCDGGRVQLLGPVDDGQLPDTDSLAEELGATLDPAQPPRWLELELEHDDQPTRLRQQWRRLPGSGWVMASTEWPLDADPTVARQLLQQVLEAVESPDGTVRLALEDADRSWLEAECAASPDRCADAAGAVLARGHQQLGMQTLETRCQAQDAAACHALAGHISRGPQAERVALLLDRACALGHGRACMDLALSWRQGQLPPPPGLEAAPAVLDMLEHSCELGEATACGQRGVEQVLGQLTPADPDAAVPWLERGCSLGSAKACFDLGALTAGGDLGRPRRGRARKLLQQACDGGYARGCAALEAL